MSFTETLALILEDLREADRDFSRWIRGEVWPLRVVWCFLKMCGAVEDVVKAVRTASGAKLVSLVKGLDISAFGNRMGGVCLRTRRGER